MTLRKRAARFAALALPLALLSTACASGETENPGPAEPATIESVEDIDLTGEKIRFIVSPPDVLATNLEYMLDLLEEWGAEIDRVEVLSTTGLQALLANQVDFATNGADELILGGANGADVVGIASHRAKMDYILVANEKFDSVSDLEGATIGVSGPGGFDALMGRLTLEAAGVDSTGVNWLHIGNSGDRAAALVSNRIDATTIFLSDWLALSKRSDQVVELARMADSLGNFPKEAVFGTTKYIAENPNVALAVACANLEANLWFETSREAWIEKALDFVPTTERADAEELYDLVLEVGMYPTSAGELLIPNGLQDLADAMLENGDIQQNVDAPSLIDHSFLDQAAAIGCGAG